MIYRILQINMAERIRYPRFYIGESGEGSRFRQNIQFAKRYTEYSEAAADMFKLDGQDPTSWYFIVISPS